MSRIVRILALVALIILGVRSVLHAEQIIVTESPVVVETPVAHVRRHAPRVEKPDAKPEAKPEAKPARTATPWSLPVSCTTAKWYMTHFSESALEKMRIAAGKPAPTALQKQQARDCLAGLRPND